MFAEGFCHDSREEAPLGAAELASARQLRGAFSDTEDFIDQGLVSANRCLSRTSSISSWTENIKPSFTKKLKFQSVLEGEPVELKCKLIACPPPTILWFHNNRSIPKERRRRICTESRMHIHNTSLVIESIKDKDSGSYRVMAINSEGSAESTASLLVSLREEQSANYLGFVRRSVQAHESADNMAEQRKEQKFRVDLRCVGSPFDKMSKVHQGRSRSKSALMRTVYFKSSTSLKEVETEKESKCLETASERAPSPPPMFDKSERFNDRFSDIYCYRRSGARFSDKFSDRCSDRYSERFSDTESLHNEVRTKLTSLQKAVKHKKRLSVCTMSSSEFELESVASESSYAEYAEKLRAKPASLSDVQPFNRPLDTVDTPGEVSAKMSARPRTRHSFEPQSRTRAIQMLRGELVETIKPLGERTTEKSYSETIEDRKDVSDVRQKQMKSEFPTVIIDQKVDATKTDDEPSCTKVLESEICAASGESGGVVPAQEGMSSFAGPKPVREKLLHEQVSRECAAMAGDVYEDEGAGSLRAHYEKSLEADRRECEEKLLALRIRKWQQGSILPEEEEFYPEKDLPMPAEAQDESPTVKSRLIAAKSLEKKYKAEVESSVFIAANTESTEAKFKETEVEALHGLKSKSPRIKARSAEVEIMTEDRLIESPRSRKLAKETFPSDEPQGTEVEESLRMHYERSLEADRMECEEKLLALRIRKWQQGVQTSEEETFYPEAGLPVPDVASLDVARVGQQLVMEKGLPVGVTPETIKGPERAEEKQAFAPLTNKGLECQTRELKKEGSPTFRQKSPRIKERPLGLESPSTKEKMLKSQKQELQLSMENLSELKNESEMFASEEEALAQRIMKWQQDVLMEQGQVVKLESDWGEASSQVPRDLDSGRSLRDPSVSQSLQELAVANSRKISVVKEAEENLLLSHSAPAGFQDPGGDVLQWSPDNQLPTEGRETRLERDSEYFVSEEEALAQRILKWQQDGAEPEELESEWALDNQSKSTDSRLIQQAQVSPFPDELHPSFLTPHTAVPEETPTPAKPSALHSFRTEVREDKAIKEGIVAMRGTKERKQERSPEGSKRERRGEDSVRSRQSGITEKESFEKRTKERSVEETEVTDTASSKTINEDHASAAGSHPIFVQEISSLKVKTGEMSEFSCHFKGDPPLTIYWLKNGQPLDHNPDYDIVSKLSNSKLIVFYPTTDHEGIYECIVSNKHGKSMSSATLEISDKKVSRKAGVVQEITVTKELEQEDENLENVLEEELQAYMDPGKATLQVPQTAIHKRRHSDESFTSSPVEIRITAATPIPDMPEESSEDRPQALTENILDVSSDDEFSQTVKHKFTFSFDFVDEAPPHVVQELENIACPEGSTAELKCTISGEPVPEVAWYFEDTCLKVVGGKYGVQVEGKVYRLYISNFTHTDAGLYKCIGRNKLGEVSSCASVSCQVEKPVKFSKTYETVVGEGIIASAKINKSDGLHKTVSQTEPQTEVPSGLVIKAPKSRPVLSAEPPTLSGCGLHGSAAIIKVSQIKQAFESDSLETLMTPPSIEEQKKDTQFPEEFIPSVTIMTGQNEQVANPGFDSQHAECSHEHGSPVSPYSLDPSLHPSETVPVIFDTSQPPNTEVGTSVRSDDAMKQFVEKVQESAELVKPVPQKPPRSPEKTSEMAMGKEPREYTFDRTSSFIPFKSDKVPAVKPLGRATTPSEEPVTISSYKGELPDVLSCSKATGGVEEWKELEGNLDEEIEIPEKSCVLAQEVTTVAKEATEELNQMLEPSMDSGGFVSLPESQADVMDRAEKEMIVDVESTIIGDDDQAEADEKAEPNLLIVKPKSNLPVKPYDTEDGISLERVLSDEVTETTAAAVGAFEEEVTFGSVYNYYNPPVDWGRPLSPESEMSIEIGSTVSEEIAEVAERFYTPGSSTEVSQPIAESLHTLKSPTSFHTPSSDMSGRFMTPEEETISPAERKKSSTGGSNESFFPPYQFPNSPADAAFETLTSVVNVDENQFLSQRGGSMGLGTLQEKVQGIPPAFLKPLIKKRLFENDTLRFYAEVFGLPSPEVRWFFRKKLLVADDRVTMERDGDNISLTIHNVTKADQGEYICEAVNYVGEARSVALVGVISQEVNLIPAPPAVTHQHVMEFDVEEHDSRSPSPQEILLEVELDENEVKEFEKQVKIITIPEYTADNKSMVISLDVLPSIYEEGTVDFVTQEHDDLKIAFEVTEMPPRFINPICDVETSEGSTVMFECSLMGIPSPVVSWFKGDKKIPHNNKKYLHSSDGDNHLLKIFKVSPQDSGVYTCRAINLVGETLCRACLVVLNAKAFSGKTRGRELTAVSLGSAKVQPQKFDLLVGNPSFDSEQMSEIELEFEFEQEVDESQRGVRLVANTDNETSEQGLKYVSINFDVFAEPAKDDKIEFKGKSSDMCSFQFQVTEIPPKCIVPLMNVTAAVGTPVILQCLVKGKPTPTAAWYRDGDPITDSRCIIQEKTVGHFNLLITNVTHSDAGEYKCVIKNSAGCIETTALLKVF